MKDRNIQRNLPAMLFLLFFCSATALFLHAPAYAQTAPQQAISISPIITDLTLQAGQKTTYHITLSNNAAIPIGMSVQPGAISALQIPDMISSDTAPSPFLSWVTISPTTFILSEHGQKTITVTINPPQTAKTSGYYAALTFVPFLSQQRLANKPVILAHIVGLLFATIGTLDYNNLLQKTHILSFQPTQWVFEKTPATLSFVVGNTYFTHFSAKPFLTITPLFGKPTTTLLEEKHILPQTARVWNQTVSPAQYAPLYFAHLAVSLGDGKQISADTWFVVLPYRLLLSVCLVFVLLLCVLLRKRFARALSILLKG